MYAHNISLTLSVLFILYLSFVTTWCQPQKISGATAVIAANKETPNKTDPSKTVLNEVTNVLDNIVENPFTKNGTCPVLIFGQSMQCTNTPPETPSGNDLVINVQVSGDATEEMKLQVYLISKAVENGELEIGKDALDQLKQIATLPNVNAKVAALRTWNSLHGLTISRPTPGALGDSALAERDAKIRAAIQKEFDELVPQILHDQNGHITDNVKLLICVALDLFAELYNNSTGISPTYETVKAYLQMKDVSDVSGTRPVRAEDITKLANMLLEDFMVMDFKSAAQTNEYWAANFVGQFDTAIASMYDYIQPYIFQFQSISTKGLAEPALSYLSYLYKVHIGETYQHHYTSQIPMGTPDEPYALALYNPYKPYQPETSFYMKKMDPVVGSFFASPPVQSFNPLVIDGDLILVHVCAYVVQSLMSTVHHIM